MFLWREFAFASFSHLTHTHSSARLFKIKFSALRFLNYISSWIWTSKVSALKISSAFLWGWERQFFVLSTSVKWAYFSFVLRLTVCRSLMSQQHEEYPPIYFPILAHIYLLSFTPAAVVMVETQCLQGSAQVLKGKQALAHAWLLSVCFHFTFDLCGYYYYYYYLPAQQCNFFLNSKF